MSEYESKLGIFSPDGRLIQVEYAQHASNQGGTIILQANKDRIDVCYETRMTNPLLIQMSKIHVVDQERNIYMIFSGFKPDSLVVIQETISIICNYKYSTSEDISLNMLAKRVAKFKQGYTVSHRMRPLGLRSFLFGIERGIPRIFVIETDGNFAEYDKYALGFKNEVCNEILEKLDSENAAFKAISEVVQSDPMKLKAFTLDEQGIIEMSKEQITILMN